MEWIDKGFLLNKNKYNENSVIAEIFTENHGKVSGFIFGASSKKIKNYLEIGNLLHLNYKFKNDNSIGYFNIEILKPYSVNFFFDKNKLHCFLSALNLIRLLTPEKQLNIKIFNLIEELFENLDSYLWIQKYIFWELELFKTLGYDLNLEKIVSKERNADKNNYYVVGNNIKKKVPNFLVEKKINEESLDELIFALRLVGDYLIKSILTPNSLNYPATRSTFVDSIKIK